MCFIRRLPKTAMVPRMAEPAMSVRSTRLVNRGGSKSIPQAVWDKVGGDGTVIADMGPSNLLQSLEPIWPEDRNHITVKDVQDWFASYVYLPRLRDEATLDGAIQRLVADLAAPYVYASGYDDKHSVYTGVADRDVGLLHDIGDGLLVRRDTIRPAGVEVEDTEKKPSPTDETAAEQAKDVKNRVPTKPKPKRFFCQYPNRIGACRA